MRNLVLAVLGGVVLAGCANLAALNGFATGPVGVRASPCEVAVAGGAAPRDMFSDTRTAHMIVGAAGGSGGGWCGWAVRLQDENGVQYGWDRATVVRAPAHGEVRVRPDGLLVHIEYRAAPLYRGADGFAVRLAPGFSVREASVDVVAPAPGAAVPETVITSTRWIGDWLYPPSL
jgi:hypothetical protein